MKFSIFSIVLFFFVPGCNNSKKISICQNNPEVTCLHETSWISNFKDEVFISCLKKLYPADFRRFFDANDASSSANIDWLQYNIKVSSIIDSLAENFTKRPEAKWEIEGGKVTMNVCLEFRMSKELDSIAVVYYHKYYVEP